MQTGKCWNDEECDNARNRVIERVADGAPFECSLCRRGLVRVFLPPRRHLFPKAALALGGALSAIALAAVAANIRARDGARDMKRETSAMASHGVKRSLIDRKQTTHQLLSASFVVHHRRRSIARRTIPHRTPLFPAGKAHRIHPAQPFPGQNWGVPGEMRRM